MLIVCLSATPTTFGLFTKKYHMPKTVPSTKPVLDIYYYTSTFKIHRHFYKCTKSGKND